MSSHFRSCITRNTIPHSRPWITPLDREAVVSALRKKAVSAWYYYPRLAEKLCSCAGLRQCRLFASGTSAIRAAVVSLGLPDKSGVAIPAFTCKGVLEGVIAAGGKPRIIDCDENGLMRREGVLRAYSSGKIRACIAVHQFGMINRAAEIFTKMMPVIEDCSHVPPKRYLSGSAGIVGSLEGTKLIGAGEGGYLLTNSSGELQRKGKHDCQGERVSDLIAVLALAQIERIVINVKRRKGIAENYLKALRGAPVVDGERACWFRFIVRMDSLSSVNKLIMKAGKACIELKRPIMPHPLNKYLTQSKREFPMAEKLFGDLVSIPLYPDLTDKEVSRIAWFLKRELG